MFIKLPPQINELVYTIEANSFLKTLAIFCLSLLISWAIGMILKAVIVRKLSTWFKKTENKFDDIILDTIRSVGLMLYLAISILITNQFVKLPDIVVRFTKGAALIVIMYYIIRFITSFSDYFISVAIDKRIKKEAELENGEKTTKIIYDPSITRFLKVTVKIVIWVLGIIVVLQNLDFDVSALVGGLGLAGIAIGFAMQNILEDVFSYITIFFDKPFKTGDFIVLGADSGTVKNVGVKSTRIKTLSGEELVVSNKELVTTRINNYKKMKERRVLFNIGVTYETDNKQLDKIPDIIKEVIEPMNKARFDRAHLKEFGEFSLNYEIVYFLEDKDYNFYMDTQEQINLKIKENFEKENIEFAYPTQTVFIEK